MCNGLENKSKFEDIIKNRLKLWDNNQDIPVVALVLDANNKIISIADNSSVKKNQIYGHAEINAIQKAMNKTNNYKLINYKIVCSLEPCMMCVGAIKNVGIKEIYYYLPSLKMGFIESNHVLNLLKWKTKLIKNDLTILIKQKLSCFFKKLR